MLIIFILCLKDKFKYLSEKAIPTSFQSRSTSIAFSVLRNSLMKRGQILLYRQRQTLKL